MTRDGFIEALEGVVGASHVVTDPDLLAAHEVDWTGRWRGTARAVVRPATTGEVAGVVRACATHRVPVVPQGGNTGLVGGGVPRDGHLVLSLRRLDHLGAVERADGHTDASVVVGAGATLAEVQRHARATGLTYGVDLAARDTATIGGTIATDAGGLGVVRHGTTRAQVLGLEAVLADGTIVDRLHPPLVDGLGYDLRGLVVGSEGTLGVVTAARVRLVRPPAHLAVVVVATTSVAVALEVQQALAGAVGPLEASELMTRTGLELLAATPGLRPPFRETPAAAVLIEVAGGPAIGEELAEAVAVVLAEVDGIEDAVMGVEAGDRAALWELRERHTERLAEVGVRVKLDVVLPLARLAGFVEGLDALVRAVGGRDAEVVVFGHLGVGDLHCNVLGVEDEAVAAVEHAVLAAVVSAGGAPCGEHGVGVQKRAWLAQVRPPGELRAMHAVKAALDPAGILNPGVLLPASLPGQEEGPPDHLVEDEQGQGPAEPGHAP